MKKILKMLKWTNLKATMSKYGETLTVQRFLLYILGFGVGVASVCYYLKLQWYYITALSIFGMCLVPFIMLALYKNKYEAVRFDEVVNYCEQMIYSFRKKQKVRVALEDVEGTSQGYLKEVIAKAIDYIDNGNAKKDLYIEALNIIQSEYNCSRIETLHSYMKEVEATGGDSRKPLSILLQDVRDWSIRTIVFQKKRIQIRQRVLVSIVLALFTCSMMFNFIPAEYVNQIVENPVYQLCTTFVLGMCMIIYLFICTKLGQSYLDNELREGKTNVAIHYVHKLEKYDKVKESKNLVIMCIILICGAGVCFYLGLGYVSLAPIAIMLYLIFDYMTKISSWKKKIASEINMEFPTWLRSLILHLQTDNVHVALKDSLKVAPEVMKPELKKLLVAISQDPNSILPYTLFMSDYNVPELKSSIRFLYSLATFGTDDMSSQLDQLVQQNAVLAANAEEMRNDQNLAFISSLTFAPMIVACAKLVVDMALFFMCFMGYMSGMGM